MTRLALVGAGERGRGHVSSTYVVRDRDFIEYDEETAWAPNYPFNVYQEYADEIPDWARDISHIEPEFTAIFDPATEACEKTQRLCRDNGDDPSVYGEFDEFLDDADTYDAVIVASPNEYHVEQSTRLLELDLDVLCEKPVATTLPDHDRLIDEVSAASSTFYPGFNLRCSPFYTRLKDLIADGSVGELGMISCRECRGHFTAEYSFTEAGSGGTLLDKNCHDFDLYNWYAESDPVRVSAFGGQHVHGRNTDVVDQAVVQVEYANGVLGSLDLCMYAPFDERVRMYELRGSAGLLRAPNEPRTVDRYTRTGTDRLTVDETIGGHGGADPRQMLRFLSTLRDEAEQPATIEDAKKADAIALAGRRAISTGKTVDLDGDYNFE